MSAARSKRFYARDAYGDDVMSDWTKDELQKIANSDDLHILDPSINSPLHFHRREPRTLYFQLDFLCSHLPIHPNQATTIPAEPASCALRGYAHRSTPRFHPGSFLPLPPLVRTPPSWVTNPIRTPVQEQSAMNPYRLFHATKRSNQENHT